MKTSLIEIKKAEKFLAGEMEFGDALVYQAHLHANPLAMSDFGVMKRIFSVLKLYRREKIRSTITTIHRDVFNDPTFIVFRSAILQSFKSE